jgi:hypothetical protein
MGLTIESLDVPVYLKAGKLQTVFGDALGGKTDDTKPPKPAACNGGELDLGNLVLDLSADVPRVTVPKNKQIVKNISINPALGDSIGKFINPVFANSTRASGYLTVLVEYCDGVALGEKLYTPQSGRAKVGFSLAQMDIANPLGPLIAGSVGFLGDIGSKTEAFRGEIRNGVVTLERGVTTQDITFAVSDPKAKVEPGKKPPVYPLNFKGDVTLQNLAQSITLTLPPEFLGDVGKYLPGGLPLSLGGTTPKPKIDAAQAAKAFGEAQVKAGVGNLLGGGGDKNKGGTKDDGRSKDKDPLGGLTDQLGGKDKKKDDRK